MLTVIDDRDRRVRDFIQSNDQFLYAEPSWKVHVLYQLPPEVVAISIEEINRMAVRIAEEKDIPERLRARGTVSNLKDYSDAIVALRTTPATKGLVITMEDPGWSGVKRPEVTFANTLRRLFTVKNMPFTAYQSGKMEITIRKATALDQSSRKKK